MGKHKINPHQKTFYYRDFPDGLAIKNLPSYAEDVGSIPYLGTKISHAAGPLSWPTVSTEPACSRAQALQQERPMGATTRGKKPVGLKKDPAQPRKKDNGVWSSNPTPGYILQQNYNLKGYIHPYIHNSTIYNIQDMETTQMSFNRGMNKDRVNMCNGILLTHQKQWNNVNCNNIDEPRDYHTKQNKSER